MSRDHVAIVAALVVHAVLGVALALTPRRPAGLASRTIFVDVHEKLVVAPKPPQRTPVLPMPVLPKREKLKTRRLPEPLNAKAPDETKPPPEEPPREPPNFHGATLEATTDRSSDFSVPVGNTLADPNMPGKRGDVISALPQDGHGLAPVSLLDLSREPRLDDDPISRAGYPDGQAKDIGLEGETILSLEIDDKGKVRGVKVVRSIGGGAAGAELDRWVQRRAFGCRFRPALDKKGRPVEFVIPVYHVLWTLNQ